MAKLQLSDIADLRAYEKERDGFRASIIALKAIRRVSVGPIVSLVFENSQTVRFQVQEMARAERILSEERIQEELDTYNPLVPEPGELCATMFIELTTEDELRNWLPKLAGIERCVQLQFGVPGSGEPEIVQGEIEDAHSEQLTREGVTAAVNYLTFRFENAQVARFADGPVQVAIRHPEYEYLTALTDDARFELSRDLTSGG